MWYTAQVRQGVRGSELAEEMFPKIRLPFTISATAEARDLKFGLVD